MPSLSGKPPAFLPSKPPPPSLLPQRFPLVITHSQRSGSKCSPECPGLLCFDRGGGRSGASSVYFELSAPGWSGITPCAFPRSTDPGPTHLKPGRGGGRAATGTSLSSHDPRASSPSARASYRLDAIIFQACCFHLFSLSHTSPFGHFPLVDQTKRGRR